MQLDTLSLASRRLGELLVDSALVTPADIAKALAFQQQFGGRMGSILVRPGALSDESLFPILSTQLGIPLMAAEERPVDAAAMRQIVDHSGLMLDWWIDNGVAAWSGGENDQVRVVARDPLDPSINEILSRHLQDTRWEWRLARTQDVDRMLDLLSRSAAASDLLFDRRERGEYLGSNRGIDEEPAGRVASCPVVGRDAVQVYGA